MKLTHSMLRKSIRPGMSQIEEVSTLYLVELAS